MELRRQSIDDAVAFSRLHALPRLPRAIAIQVRMPAFHLREKRLRDIMEVERSALLRDHGMKEHLEQKITELLAQHRVISSPNRIIYFIGFLDQIWTQ